MWLPKVSLDSPCELQIWDLTPDVWTEVGLLCQPIDQSFKVISSEDKRAGPFGEGSAWEGT